jgi:hypothetical protein
MKQRKQAPLRSDIAWSTPDRIEVFGYDLPRELIGHVNLGDMGFLEIVGRLPRLPSLKCLTRFWLRWSRRASRRQLSPHAWETANSRSVYRQVVKQRA